MGPHGPPFRASAAAPPRPAPRRASVDRGRAPSRPRARAVARLPGGPDLHALGAAVGAAPARRGGRARLRGGARGDRHPGAARARLLPAQPGGAGRIAARALGARADRRVPPERREVHARRAGRSPRAHRPGRPRRRCLPPAAARPALPRSADVYRDAEGRRPGRRPAEPGRAEIARMRRAALGLLALVAACARHTPPPPRPAPPEPPRSGVTVTLRWTAPVDLDLYVTDPSLETVYFANPRTASGGVLERDARCAGREPGEQAERATWRWRARRPSTPTPTAAGRCRRSSRAATTCARAGPASATGRTWWTSPAQRW